MFFVWNVKQFFKILFIIDDFEIFCWRPKRPKLRYIVAILVCAFKGNANPCENMETVIWERNQSTKPDFPINCNQLELMIDY